MILTFLMYALTNNMNYRGVNRFEHDFDDFQKQHIRMSGVERCKRKRKH